MVLAFVLLFSFTAYAQLGGLVNVLSIAQDPSGFVFAQISDQIVSANPTLQAVLQQYQTMRCAIDIATCAASMVQGKIQQELMNQLTTAVPEAEQALALYSQFQGFYEKYKDKIKVKEEIKVSEDGKLITGTLQYQDTDIEFRNIIGEFDEENGITTFKFEEEDSALVVGEASFRNVKPGTDSYVKVNNDGKVTEAQLVAAKQTTFNFNGKLVEVPAGAKVTYKNGEITVEAKPEGVDFKFFTSEESIPQNYEISGEGYVKFTENGLEVYGETIVRDKDFGFEVYNHKGNTLLITDSKEKISGFDNWMVVKEESLEFNGNGYDIFIEKSSPWISDKAQIPEGKGLVITPDGHGSIYLNGETTILERYSGSIDLTDCEDSYTIENEILRNGNYESCVDMLLFSENNMVSIGKGVNEASVCKASMPEITGKPVLTRELEEKLRKECSTILKELESDSDLSRCFANTEFACSNELPKGMTRRTVDYKGKTFYVTDGSYIKVFLRQVDLKFHCKDLHIGKVSKDCEKYVGKMEEIAMKSVTDEKYIRQQEKSELSNLGIEIKSPYLPDEKESKSLESTRKAVSGATYLINKGGKKVIENGVEYNKKTFYFAGKYWEDSATGEDLLFNYRYGYKIGDRTIRISRTPKYYNFDGREIKEGDFSEEDSIILCSHKGGKIANLIYFDTIIRIPKGVSVEKVDFDSGAFKICKALTP